MLDICLLGTGGMMPLPTRYLTAMVARYKGRKLLIDCGEGTQVAMKELGWGYKTIDTICFTHYHGDHVTGLPGLLLTIGNSGREEPITIIGPQGLEEIIKGLLVIAPELPFELNLIELSNEESSTIQCGEIELHTLPVEHNVPCLAYNMEIKRNPKFNVKKAKKYQVPKKFWTELQMGNTVKENGKLYEPYMVQGKRRKGLKVSYCTDCRPNIKIPKFVQNSDLLICEGMYGEDEYFEQANKYKHMIYKEAAEIAKKGKVTELWLTHFSPAMSEPEKHIEYANRIFLNSIVGEDLMVKELRFN
ncbi:ribonuclease Z [Dethiothermospora halolimnae]|uniref:ribonuclease Z n=1 Tax=Dethiothermospora halolimnae TaxID=3114390 RepID=UPI003CCBB143